MWEEWVWLQDSVFQKEPLVWPRVGRRGGKRVPKGRLSVLKPGQSCTNWDSGSSTQKPPQGDYHNKAGGRQEECADCLGFSMYPKMLWNGKR